MDAKRNGWLVLVLLLGTMVYALAEEITLTTYYPSPRGVYNELRTLGNVQVGSLTPPAFTPSPRLYVVLDDLSTAPALRVDDQEGDDPTPFVVDAAGNVLIGTQTLPPTNPKLYVVGSVEADAFRAFEDTGVYAFVESGGSPGDGWAQLGGWNVATDSPAPTYLDGTPLALQTRPGSGNVGIGTTSPTSSTGAGRFIEIEGPMVTSLEFDFPNAGLGGGGDAVGGVVFNRANTRLASIFGGTDAATNSGRLQFSTTNAGTSAVQMVLDRAGNVGIGTASPQAKLDVQGGAVRVPVLASAPSSPLEGMIYFDDTEKRYKGYQNGQWIYFSNPSYTIVTESWINPTPTPPGTTYTASYSCPAGYLDGGCKRSTGNLFDYYPDQCQCYTEGASCGTVTRKCYVP